ASEARLGDEKLTGSFSKIQFFSYSLKISVVS
ncbi:MAG: hypothetical protein ACI9A7_001033, partial [Cyclobacteriaceae bacterium]